MIREQRFVQLRLLATGLSVLVIGMTACTHTIKQNREFWEVGIKSSSLEG